MHKYKCYLYSSKPDNTMRIKIISFAFIALGFSNIILAQSNSWNPFDDNYPQSCTSITVGKKASTDGSVMTSHTCDSNFRTWLTLQESKTFKPGEKDTILWGTLHTEERFDPREIEKRGVIPAPTTPTFKYLNVAYPCMNEKQLAIGETTTEGRQDLRRNDGMFLIEELERIALQRCSTARQAIALIGSLAEEYGFADNGECLTIADKKEVWHFEIYGNGTLPQSTENKKSKKQQPDKPGALWVAVRLPDDHVGISANIPRIGKVDFADTVNFMYSKDLKERTKALGYWNPKEDFIFWKVIYDGKKNFSSREFYVLSKLAPSLNLKFSDPELPFSVKPDKKVSPEDLFAFFRATYEGTEFDCTKDLFVEVNRARWEGRTVIRYKDTTSPVSPFMSADMRTLINHLKPGATNWTRAIAVNECSYSHIIQCRDYLPDEIGAVAYFSFDNPAQSPRIPIYIGSTSLPKGWEVCGQKRYRKDAAIWSYRETNRIAAFNWYKTRHLLEPQIDYYQKQVMLECGIIEQQATKLIQEGKKNEAIDLLNKYTQKMAAATAKTWEDLKADLWQIFARGF